MVSVKIRGGLPEEDLSHITARLSVHLGFGAQPAAVAVIVVPVISRPAATLPQFASMPAAGEPGFDGGMK
jgi:hypothetical protein